MVNAINLTMTSKGDIATWKANRRKLAYSTVGTPDYVGGGGSGQSGAGAKDPDCRWDLRSRFHPRFSYSKGMERNVIGGHWALSCTSA
jgi:hypothetical protein